MQEHDRPRRVTNGMHREIHDALAAVGHPVAELLPKRDPGCGLLCREADPRLHLLRAAPPGRLPEQFIQDLLPGVSAPFHGQLVHFAHIALQVQDARENARLIENGFEFGGGI